MRPASASQPAFNVGIGPSRTFSPLPAIMLLESSGTCFTEAAERIVKSQVLRSMGQGLGTGLAASSRASSSIIELLT